MMPSVRPDRKKHKHKQKSAYLCLHDDFSETWPKKNINKNKNQLIHVYMKSETWREKKNKQKQKSADPCLHDAFSETWPTKI